MILTDVGSQINLLPREKLIFRKLYLPLWQYCETLYVFFRNRTPFYSVHESLPPATKFGQGYAFTRVCYSVHRGVVSQHALQVSSSTPRRKLRGLAWGVLQAHTQRGKLRGLAWGVSRPTLGGSPGSHLEGCPGPQLGGSPGPHPGGCPVPHMGVSQQTTPRRLLLRAVRILLECIPVKHQLNL